MMDPVVCTSLHQPCTHRLLDKVTRAPRISLSFRASVITLIVKVGPECTSSGGVTYERVWDGSPESSERWRSLRRTERPTHTATFPGRPALKHLHAGMRARASVDSAGLRLPYLPCA